MKAVKQQIFDISIFTFFSNLIFRKNKTRSGEQVFISAEEEIRTPKPFRALPPQSSASTNFATSAIGLQI
jgi:hypothetical protein